MNFTVKDLPIRKPKKENEVMKDAEFEAVLLTENSKIYFRTMDQDNQLYSMFYDASKLLHTPKFYTTVKKILEEIQIGQLPIVKISGEYFVVKDEKNGKVYNNIVMINLTNIKGN